MGGDWSRSSGGELITPFAISQSPNQYGEARGSACFSTVMRNMKGVSACVGFEGFSCYVAVCIDIIDREVGLLFPLFEPL